MAAPLAEALCCVGIFLSLYAYYVEIKSNQDPNYSPLCNINDSISCTRVFNSKYGSIFYIPNSILGALFFSTALAMCYFKQYDLVFLMSCCGAAGNLLFAYLLYFKLHDFCIVCNLIYLTTFALLFASYRELREHVQYPSIFVVDYFLAKLKLPFLPVDTRPKTM
eukprot:GEZU01013666.1.p1 GENE.GEZU01013666.1~~GEZU01013666.1.p1  ORF type:complete len:175 (+),score=36.22 GEZU01013666.1:33-527(+)